MMMKKLLTLMMGFGFAGLGCSVALGRTLSRTEAIEMKRDTNPSCIEIRRVELEEGKFLLPCNLNGRFSDSNVEKRVADLLCGVMKELQIAECNFFIVLRNALTSVVYPIHSQDYRKYIPPTRRGNKALQEPAVVDPAPDVAEEIPVAEEAASSSAAHESKEEKIARLAAEKKELDELTAGINEVGQASKAPKNKSKKR